jgi:hypothetical protein
MTNAERHPADYLSVPPVSSLASLNGSVYQINPGLAQAAVEF